MDIQFENLRRRRRLANNTIGRPPPPIAASPVNIRPAGTGSRYFAVLRRCRAGAERGRVHPPADTRLPTAYLYTGLSLATVVTAVRADAGSATRLAHILCMVRQ